MFCCVFLNQTNSFACDACGSTASNMGIGLLTNYKSNFIRIGMFNTRFSTTPEHEYNVSDQFSQIELAVRYAAGGSKRIKLMAHLPYGFNRREADGVNSTITGFSDTRLIANYSLINSIDIGEDKYLYLELGGGLSLPTGKYDNAIHDKNLPLNFNIGRGALGYIFQLNSVFTFGQNGILLNQNFQSYRPTSNGYKFGNQYNSQLNLFRTFELNFVDLIPNIGIGFEKVSQDEFKSGNSETESGGDGVYCSLALNVKTEQWITGISIASPIKHNYSNGTIDAKSRLACHFTYIF
jgi:hypothetical protein